MKKNVVIEQIIRDKIFLKYENGDIKVYPLIFLGCEWFKMSNDAFFEIYGFNFNPHEIPGLYDKCRQIVFGGEA